ncbi:hypothetical protein [Caballeronia mineralivorans]|jgi:hypothetical protein|uniref:hypothetical protein n=1 Tax=Caballeronia mineralivorans TaxID=2010198 RepID=UPI0023F0E820|nr:hypothetical protein [Caballeronia mineralivorans]MDB5788230.1 hypothetical protein [Caballeronia mineralivorans]
MPKHDFTHLRATPAQSRERHTGLNAEEVGSWDAPMRKAQAEARAAASEPGSRASATSSFNHLKIEGVKSQPDSSASATSGWDRAMRRVLSR